MKVYEIKNLSELERFLRNFKNWNDEVHLYDFGAVVSLWLSLTDNMRKFALRAELEDIGYRMTDEQRQFLAKLSECANAVTDEDVEKD